MRPVTLHTRRRASIDSRRDPDIELGFPHAASQGERKSGSDEDAMAGIEDVSAGPSQRLPPPQHAPGPANRRVSVCRTLSTALLTGVLKGSGQVVAAQVGETVGAMFASGLEALVKVDPADHADAWNDNGNVGLAGLVLVLTGMAALVINCGAADHTNQFIAAATGHAELASNYVLPLAMAVLPLAIVFAGSDVFHQTGDAAGQLAALAVTSLFVRLVAGFVRDYLTALGKGVLPESEPVGPDGNALGKQQAWDKRNNDAWKLAFPLNAGMAGAGQFGIAPGVLGDGQKDDVATDGLSTSGSFADKVLKGVPSSIVKGLYQVSGEMSKGLVAVAQGGGLRYKPGNLRFWAVMKQNEPMGKALQEAWDHNSVRIVWSAASDLVTASLRLVEPGSKAELMVKGSAAVIGALAETRGALVEAGKLAMAPGAAPPPGLSRAEIASGVASAVVGGVATAAVVGMTGGTAFSTALATTAATGTLGLLAGALATKIQDYRRGAARPADVAPQAGEDLIAEYSVSRPADSLLDDIAQWRREDVPPANVFMPMEVQFQPELEPAYLREIERQTEQALAGQHAELPQVIETWLAELDSLLANRRDAPDQG